LFTLWLGFMWDTLPSELVFLLPYLCITALFAGAVAMGHCRRIWPASILLLLGFVVPAALCTYDLSQDRYQFMVPGEGKHYTIWWWYYDPFWHGYRPGNV